MTDTCIGILEPKKKKKYVNVNQRAMKIIHIAYTQSLL